MAILDRVKARTETDLPDDEIQLMIDEANQDIIYRYGPHPDPNNPITELLEGWRKRVVVSRSIDISQPITITEYFDSAFGQTTYDVQPTDWRFWPPSSLERRMDGLTMNPRLLWADRVEVTYVPTNDGDQREEVIVKLAILAIQYDSFTSQTVGDYSGVTGDYKEERRKLLDTLAPRHGLTML